MQAIWRHLIFVLTLLTFLGLDLWTKEWAFSSLPAHGEHIVIEGWLRFHRVENPGMMWGMAQEVPAAWWVLIRSGVLFGLLWLYLTLVARTRLVQFAFGLVAAGALGNITDNVFHGDELFTGHVRDFINFYWFKFPTFNVADSCICVGAPLLLIVLWDHDAKRARSTAKLDGVTT